jgi:O-antigen ligase
VTPPGATLELPNRPAEPSGPSSGRPWRPPFAAAPRDDWPRTNRLIPWLLAAFIAMLWLVPFDSTTARFNAPFDPKLDRLLISVMALAWIASVFAGGRVAPRWHRTQLDWAVLAFVGVAITSVLLNIGTLVPLNEHELALKKLSLLFSYATFFFIVATTIRPREIARFVKLFCVLAVVTAAGVLYQKYGGSNLFYDWWNRLVPDALFEVQGATTSAGHAGPVIGGPAKHPLALTLMMAIALPFMVVGVLNSRERRAQILYTIGFAVMVSAIFATSRKTGSYAMIAAMGTLVLMRPRQMLQLVPHALTVFVALLLLFPTAVQFQLEQVSPGKIADGASGDNRKADYEAVIPDVRKYLVLGRGYGTYDPAKYRILDNNYLGMLLEMGILGIAGFAWMVLALLAVARRGLRSPDPARAGPALAAAGGAGAFAVGMTLFDALAYPQGPYMFFFLGAIAVVAAAPRDVRDAGVVRTEEAPTVVLPALEDELAAEPLPPLREEAEREAVRERTREREQREHGGERTRRREGLPSRRRAQPVREHVSGPLDGAPAPEADAPRRRRGAAAGAAALGGRARRAGAAGLATARKRAGTLLVGIAALAIGAFAFGGGTAPPADDDAPRLGAGGAGGDDPFGLDEFAEGGAASQRPSPRERRESLPSRPRPGRAIPVVDVDEGAPLRGDDLGGGDDLTDDPAPRGDRDGRDRRGRDRDRERERPRRRPKPRQPNPTTPPPPDNGTDEPPTEQPRDCIPGETEELLTEIGVDACEAITAETGAKVQRAYLAGRLTKAQLDLIVESLREAQRAR